MKITKQQLKQIIKEELGRGLQEAGRRDSVTHKILWAHKNYAEEVTDWFRETSGDPMGNLPDEVSNALNVINDLLHQSVGPEEPGPSPIASYINK
jgi:hypothetical protein